MSFFRRRAHPHAISWRGRVAVLICVLSFWCDVSLVPIPWRGQAAARCSSGMKAGSCENPYYDEKREAELVDLARVWGRRVEFGKFAEKLLPDVPFPVGDIKELIKENAEKLWPDCRVSLVGSCNREVHNKYFSDLDFHINDTKGGEPTPKEFADFCNLISSNRRVETIESEVDSKAIRLVVDGLPVDVDVAFPSRFEPHLQMHPPAQTDVLKQFYAQYEGAEKAARVAKWMFRDLKGMDVEYIVKDVADDSIKTWARRSEDVNGSHLFEAVVMQLLEEMCRTASMIEYACLAKDRPQTTRAKLDISFKQDRSISLKGMDLGLSVRLEADASNTTTLSATTGQNSVVQKRKKTGGKESSSSSTRFSSGGWPQKILVVFDDMLYCIERGLVNTAAATPLEHKFLGGWCTGVDAFLEMATGKKKDERWRARKMASSMQEVHEKMKELGIECVEDMSKMIRNSDMSIAFKAPILAFLLLWMRFAKF